MKIIAVIPARYNSKRFPGKLLKKIGKRTIIEQTYLSTYKTGLFDDVYVATDNEKIYSLIHSAGGKVILSDREFVCGTDRIASAVSKLDVDIVINVQGDEPFIDKNSLLLLINSLKDFGVDINEVPKKTLNIVLAEYNCKTIVNNRIRRLKTSGQIIEKNNYFFLKKNKKNFLYFVSLVFAFIEKI